jgi:MOSC domain-containing protein YiiM
MIRRGALDLLAGKGVGGDHKLGGRRHVTIVFEDDWAEALADLGRPVPPSARRANVLVDGGGGGEYVGRRIRLGTAEIEVKGLVAPCDRMDEAAAGLQAALRPGARGGIWGLVLESGRVGEGDALTSIPPG